MQVQVEQVQQLVGKSGRAGEWERYTYHIAGHIVEKSLYLWFLGLQAEQTTALAIEHNLGQLLHVTRFDDLLQSRILRKAK